MRYKPLKVSTKRSQVERKIKRNKKDKRKGERKKEKKGIIKRLRNTNSNRFQLERYQLPGYLGGNR